MTVATKLKIVDVADAVNAKLEDWGPIQVHVSGPVALF